MLRKSLQGIAHMASKKAYPGKLPPELEPYHYYIADGGHSVMCVLECHLKENQKNGMDDYELPVPVKYVLEKGHRFINGFVIVGAKYGLPFGLIVDDKYYEY